jgi:hypothetical protein
MAVFHFLNFLEGLYTDTSPILIPDGQGQTAGALHAMSNINHVFRYGTLMKRPGYQKVSATLQSGKSITGLHNFRQSSSVQKMLATVDDATSDDTQLFYKTSAGAWTEIAGAETAWANKAGIKVEMEDFSGYCYIFGYGATDGFLPPQSLTGTTIGTTNLTSVPSAKYVKRYRDRLYIANCDISGTAYPFRVYFSSVPVAGAITWDTTNDFFDVDYSEQITGIGENWDRLMIFTEYACYMYNQSEKKKVWDVGCTNHRTIKNSGAYTIFANRDGVWMTTGGRPENIAARVIDFIRTTDMTNDFAEIVDEEYHLHTGSATVNGISYSNCSIIVHIPSRTWRVNEYYDTMSIFAKYNASGHDFLYMGANDGDVHVLGKYTDASVFQTDACVSNAGDGQPIHSFFQAGAWYFGDPSSVKKFNKIMAYSDKAQGLLLKARVLDRNTLSTTSFKKLGQLTDYINEFSVNPEKGNFLQVEGVEMGSNEYWSLLGITADVSVDSLLKK